MLCCAAGQTPGVLHAVCVSYRQLSAHAAVLFGAHALGSSSAVGSPFALRFTPCTRCAVLQA
jgi:hypothetical protein